MRVTLRDIMSHSVRVGRPAGRTHISKFYSYGQQSVATNPIGQNYCESCVFGPTPSVKIIETRSAAEPIKMQVKLQKPRRFMNHFRKFGWQQNRRSRVVHSEVKCSPLNGDFVSMPTKKSARDFGGQKSFHPINLDVK